MENIYDGYECDNFTRWIATEFIKRIGATDINYTQGKNAIDLNCLLKGYKIAIEVKGRGLSNYPKSIKENIYKLNPKYKYMYSTDFGDHFIELEKANSIKKRINDQEIHTALIISIFDDDILFISDYRWKQELHQKKCNKDTHITNSGKTNKWVRIYKQFLKYKIIFNDDLTQILQFVKL